MQTVLAALHDARVEAVLYDRVRVEPTDVSFHDAIDFATKHGPDGIVAGPDGNVWFSEAHMSRIGRITPAGAVTEFSHGLTPGCRPLSPVVRDGDIWFSEYEAGQIGRITMDGRVTEYQIPTPNSEPRAMAAHPDGSIWFVQTKANGLGRIDAQGRVTEWPVKTPDASLRGVTVAPDGGLWFTENFADKIGRMRPDGTVVGEYAIPAAGWWTDIVFT